MQLIYCSADARYDQKSRYCLLLNIPKVMRLENLVIAAKDGEHRNIPRAKFIVCIRIQCCIRGLTLNYAR